MSTLPFIIFMVVLLIAPVSIGIHALGCFIGDRIRVKDKSKKIDLEKQLSIERTEAMKLRQLQIENGFTVTPNKLLDE